MVTDDQAGHDGAGAHRPRRRRSGRSTSRSTSSTSRPRQHARAAPEHADTGRPQRDEPTASASTLEQHHAGDAQRAPPRRRARGAIVSDVEQGSPAAARRPASRATSSCASATRSGVTAAEARARARPRCRPAAPALLLVSRGGEDQRRRRRGDVHAPVTQGTVIAVSMLEREIKLRVPLRRRGPGRRSSPPAASPLRCRRLQEDALFDTADESLRQPRLRRCASARESGHEPADLQGPVAARQR